MTKEIYNIKSPFRDYGYKLIIESVNDLLADKEFKKDAKEIYDFLNKVPIGTIRKLEEMLKEKPLINYK